MMNGGKRTRKVLVIGGGASGMAAAIEAARYGAAVVLLEKENRVGKKLLATGNGRCNFANVLARPDHFHGCDQTIIQSVLELMPVAEVLAFFELMGVTPKIESDGKVYPYSDQGSNVLDLLRYEMEHLGVTVKTDQQVTSCRKHKQGWQVETTTGDVRQADKVILATGGKAGSQFGANDNGYRLAESLGHTIMPLFPALVQVKLAADWLKSLKGVKWQGAASVVAGGRTMRREAGELLFTDYGISGPPILQLSRQVRDYESAAVELWIHLLPDWSSEEVVDHLMNRFHLDPDKPVELCLLGLLHKRLIPVLLREAGIRELKQPAYQVPVKAIQKLAAICRNWKITINGTLSWQQAQVTAGGVNTTEINPVTMASQKSQGLYLTGEVMDVDGDCGGFNLYWAWATGILAGRHAAGGEES
ncbi:MAG: NAD(P)/FAD-dependent oxidoreductase [Bacillota bacterium]|nr:NAD(P)/FAD-dependent oxidoreductase [Bacillota bacterium]MDW7676498.1 NAD(P)/FAD-dependent oxidoreductase [Bacillota bacterium]